MRSLRRRVSLLALAGVAVLAAPIAGAGDANADPVDDQRDRVAYYADQLEQLEEDTFRLGEEYDIAVDELADLKADVAAAEDAVAAKQAEVAELQAELADVAVQSYMDTGSSGMGIFTEPNAFNEQLQRDELARVALNSGTADADDLEQAANDLAEEQENLESQREAAEEKAEEVADAREAAEEQTEEFEEAKAEAEAELGDLIREEQERRARESYEQMQREAAAAQQQAAEQQAQAQQSQSQSQPQTQSAQPSGGGSSTSGGSSAGGASVPAAATAPVPQASSRAGTAVNAAMSQQGVAYQYAAASPGVAFDCSGLTSWAWGQAGVGLPHQSAQQYASIPHVPTESAQPGDLIFFYSPISHVGLYIGGGQMVHAPNTGSEVHVRSVNWGNVVGVGRPT